MSRTFNRVRGVLLLLIYSGISSLGLLFKSEKTFLTLVPKALVPVKEHEYPRVSKLEVEVL